MTEVSIFTAQRTIETKCEHFILLFLNIAIIHIMSGAKKIFLRVQIFFFPSPLICLPKLKPLSHSPGTFNYHQVSKC